jgi:hypothetical protein
MPDQASKTASARLTHRFSPRQFARYAAAITMTAILIQPGYAQIPPDINPTVNNPDKFAWDIFAEINRPALAGQRGVPDPNKKVSDPGLRVWETWKITTPIGSEVFLDRGQRPSPWDQAQVMNASGQPRKFSVATQIYFHER